jgi:hypothetical protein
VQETCRLQGVHVVELASDLGTLYLNQFEPGFVFLDDHGEPPVPRTGMAHSIMEEGEVKISIAVRLHFRMTALTISCGRKQNKCPKTHRAWS